MESWMWWRAGRDLAIMRAGCDEELLRAGCDRELGEIKSRVWWRATESLVWERATGVYSGVIFSSLSLWSRFIILGYRRKTALPRCLHNFDKYAYPVFYLYKCQQRIRQGLLLNVNCFTDWWFMVIRLLIGFKWNCTCNAKPPNCQINLDNLKVTNTYLMLLIYHVFFVSIDY